MSEFNVENNENAVNQNESQIKKQKRSKSPWIILAVFAVLVAVSFIFTIVAGSILIANMPEYDGGNGSSENSSSTNPVIDYSDPSLYNFVASSPTYNHSSVDLIEKTPDVEMEYTDIYLKLCPSIVRIFTSGSEFGYTSYSATGFFITADGYLFTNAHVIEGAKQVEILTYDDYLYKATVIGYDTLNDVALLKVNGNNFTPVELRDTNSLQVGEELVIIGGPQSLTLSYTMTRGILSAIRHDFTLDGERVRDLLQTDTPMNKGSSGSPLIDKNGKVIGMVSSKLYTTSGVTIEGLGFAVPMNVAVDMIEELLTYGRKLQTPAIGIVNSVFSYPSFLTPGGMAIGGTIRGSDAEAKGIVAGDILTKFNGVEVTSAEILKNEIAKCKPYEKVTIEIYSIESSIYRTIELTLGEFIEY